MSDTTQVTNQETKQELQQETIRSYAKDEPTVSVQIDNEAPHANGDASHAPSVNGKPIVNRAANPWAVRAGEKVLIVDNRSNYSNTLTYFLNQGKLVPTTITQERLDPEAVIAAAKGQDAVVVYNVDIDNSEHVAELLRLKEMLGNTPLAISSSKPAEHEGYNTLRAAGISELPHGFDFQRNVASVIRDLISDSEQTISRS